ncbi:hypothetical protein A447_04848 [Fusobacterium vincentii ATCC 51190]|uniref:Uncharacterized protein n=1 Tax=Fusobacterium vincentii TaxID=155615 RepID=A0AAJ1FMF4_FUSVC|nr:MULTISPECIES: hypothetical protein [Fusobacterium]ETS96069.1 hypothetical protein HMPREF1497_0847 [Fusobacterium sp. CM21]EJG09278.1 hypothetical protein A447_04848 [Fusobacterium vincentii ATCC 51190]ERT45612.1 hypothetical protein HMPREF1768_01230 [Fusobacterium nucleatum CTI-7]MCW0263387.1 hypothetical protein [Fusobacterium vincentii]OHU82570.1 hypothetical protein BKN39_04840 [Fusobacterium nucleatum]
MKIISKFKDFYDYKVTKYGVDEKLVYTRKTYCEYFQGFFRDINIDYRISEDDFNKNLKENTKVTDEKNIHKILFIGEKLIHLFFIENGVYTHLDIKNNEDLRKFTDFEYRKEITFKDGKKFNIYTRFKDDWEYLLSYDRKKLINLNIDKDDIILNEPILLIEYIGKCNNEKAKRYYSPSLYKFIYNPNLSQMGVYIDEDFVWQSLVEFLSIKRSEKEISPEVSDENKILSKGFDLKTSFRPNVKKKK